MGYSLFTLFVPWVHLQILLLQATFTALRQIGLYPVSWELFSVQYGTLRSRQLLHGSLNEKWALKHIMKIT